MPFSKFRPGCYTAIDWQIMTDAHRLASKNLNRHPKNHEYSDRLARTVMNFYQRGAHDVGLLAILSANRERNVTHQEESTRLVTIPIPSADLRARAKAHDRLNDCSTGTQLSQESFGGDGR